MEAGWVARLVLGPGLNRGWDVVACGKKGVGLVISRLYGGGINSTVGGVVHMVTL